MEPIAAAAPTAARKRPNKADSRQQAKPESEAAQNLLTAEQFYRMTGVGPAELINGEIVTRMPTGHPHGFIESMIAFFLTLFLREHKLGRVLTGEVGVITRQDPYTVRAADVIFISHERLAQAQAEGFLDVAPELVVEIMSPHNTWSDTQEKLAEYFAIGVGMVWVVDLQLEQIHVYRSLEQMRLLRLEDELTGEEILPGFKVGLREIFAAE